MTFDPIRQHEHVVETAKKLQSQNWYGMTGMTIHNTAAFALWYCEMQAKTCMLPE